MKTVTSLDQLTLKGTIICIGNFDGVHVGHQMLLEHMQKLSSEHRKPSAILTFFPPSKVFFQGGDYLSSEAEKLELLRVYAPDAVVVIPFNEAYTQTPKEDFLAQLGQLEPHTIIVGEDFRFGYKRQGTLNDLSHLPERLEVFGMKRVSGEEVKSTRIRQLLSEGNVEAVKPLLGRNYTAQGVVIRGDQRGRTIGFPTANVQTPKGKALPLGVFAVNVDSEQGHFKGMANVGPRPSFPNDPPSLEVYLFDFDGDVYRQPLNVHFEAFIRAQQKFSGL
ncbi:MAG: riboflavin biosynthesis protein RibF, partial [Trueperaceae bacterium]